ncbi:hypothetical protein AHAS_Ahas04G0160700 [Arachis hypogaea]
MEKSLLEFQSTKGDVLPAHKFSTHDDVVLKLNKADLGSPALGQGVVYRLKVTYRKMKDALVQLSKGVHKGPAADLIPVLFGKRLPTMSKKDCPSLLLIPILITLRIVLVWNWWRGAFRGWNRRLRGMSFSFK